MEIGMLILRVVVGGLMFGHGAQKLFGWWGGGGIRGTSGFVGSLGYPAAGALAVLGGLGEAGGGLLLALGLLTPLAAAAIAGVMFNVIVAVHWSKGIWNSNGGVEFPLVMATSAIAVAFTGPGRYSLDALLAWNLAGTSWGLAAMGVGLVAAAATLAMWAKARRALREAPVSLERAA